MKELNTAAVVAVRLLLAATIVTSAGPLPLHANAEPLTDTDAPPLPCSFYGTAMLDGAAVAEGTTISGWVDGVQVVEVGATVVDGLSLYVLDVPGDDPQTPALDGGYEGAVVVFKVAGYSSGALALWHAGEVAELDLAAIQHDGPDLAVLVDNEQTETFSGDTLTYKIAVLNIGNQTATDISLSDTLPEHTTFLAASDGGSESGGTVTWPTFDLPADGFAVRTVNVEVGNPLASGVTEIANTVTVSDDGAGGVDPTPANNTDTDTDGVAVSPALAIAFEELSECDPENPVLPPLANFLVESVQALEQSCKGDPAPGFSEQARDQVASGIRALVHEYSESPLITAGHDLLVAADRIESRSACGFALLSDLVALQDGLSELQAQVCSIASHSCSLSFNPGSTYALVGDAATYELILRNTGREATTYDVVLQSLDAELILSGPPSSFSVSLGSGEFYTATLSAAGSAVGTLYMQADVVAQEAPIVQAQATAVLRSLDSLVEITEVAAEPPFVESGGGMPATLYARISNRTQVELPALAEVQVLDPAGTPVFSTTSSLSLAGVEVPIRYGLETVETAGFADGAYTIDVALRESGGGDLIPNGSGQGALYVGQAVEASSSVSPQIVPPGDVEVTTAITTELVQFDYSGQSAAAILPPATASVGPALAGVRALAAIYAAPWAPAYRRALGGLGSSSYSGVLCAYQSAPLSAATESRKGDVGLDWQYSSAIAVFNPGSVELIDHQVRLDVDYEAGMNADFSDLRFEVEPAAGFLPQWTESYITATSAVVWVKVPSLPAMASTEITTYYGDPSAPDVSDGVAVFEFFDDFEGSAIDTARWEIIGLADRLVVSGGYLDVAVVENAGSTGVIQNGIGAISSYGVGHSVVARAKDPDASPNDHLSYVGMTTLPACHTFWSCAQKGVTIFTNTGYDFIGDSQDTSRAATTLNCGAISDWHTYRIDYAGGSLARYYRDGELKATHTSDSSIPDDAYLHPALGGNDYSNSDPHMHYDWVYVRKLADPELVLGCDWTLEEGGNHCGVDWTVDTDTTIGGTHVGIGTLTVVSGTALTLQGDTGAGTGVTIEAAGVVIEEMARISADGQGWPGTTGDGQGPGGGIWGHAYSGNGSGGAYGGDGADGLGAGGKGYGSVYQPIDLGSSGAAGMYNNASQPGGNGGGAMRIVADVLTVDGHVSANGNNGSGNGGGGAGGGVLIEVGTIAGSGTIEANGGTRGGGGRIAIYYDTDSLGLDEAVVAQAGGAGGPGTIYLWDETTSHSKLRVDNAGHSTAGKNAVITSPAAETWRLDEIELTNSGNLELRDSDDTIVLQPGGGAGDNTAQLWVHGTISATGLTELRGFGTYVYPDGYLALGSDLTVRGVKLDLMGTLEGVTNLTLAADAEAGTDAIATLHATGHTAGDPAGTFSFAGWVDVPAGQTVRMAGDRSSGAGVVLQAVDVSVADGGTISADGLGYQGSTNDGQGPGGGLACYHYTCGGGGAGYGGKGGSSTAGGGSAYGSLYAPAQLGSGGGGGAFNNSRQRGGNGGGAVYIQADTLTVDGQLSASGNDSSGYGGGGAGGGILIEVGTIAGTGAIEATGGSSSGGGGGGGRIAVYADTDSFSGTVQAAGGIGSGSGQDGTVYLASIDPLQSTADATPSDIVADGTSEGVVTVTVRTEAAYPIPDKAIQLDLISGAEVAVNGQPLAASDPAIDIGVTGADGVVTATVTATTVGPRTLGARGNEVVIQDEATLSFVPGPVDAFASRLEVDKTSVVADGVDAAVVTVTLFDSYGHPVPGKDAIVQATGTVTITQAVTTTDSLGRVSAAIRSTGVQNVVVSGYDQTDDLTIVEEATITFSTGPADALRSTITVTPTTLAADGVEQSTVIAVLHDSFDRPLVNTPVRLVLNPASGDDTIVPAGEIETDSGGLAAWSFASTSAGTRSLSLLDVDSGVSLDGGSVTFVAGPPDASTSLVRAAAPGSAPADGVSPVRVDVTVLDAYLNPISGVEVLLNAAGEGAAVVQPAEPTGEDGGTYGLVTSTRAGVVTVWATADGGLIEETAVVSFIGPDVSVQKSGPAQAAAGQTISYTLSIANYGAVAAAGVVLTDTLPAELAFVSQQSTCSFTQDGQQLAWQVGDLASGGEASVQIVVQVAASAPLGDLVNRAGAATATYEEDLADNLDAATTRVIGADLLAQISPPSPAVGVAGHPVTYTIGLSNEGLVAADYVELIDVLPTHLSYVAHTAPYPLTQAGQRLVWYIGDLEAGQEIEPFQLVVLVEDSAPLEGSVENSVEANSATSEENPADNVAAASITIEPGYQFAAWLEPETVATSIGAAATGRIKVQNTGTFGDEYSVVVGGLSASWYTLEPAALYLPAGAIGEAVISILVEDCAAASSPFQVRVTGAAQGSEELLSGQLDLRREPTIANLAPAGGARLGSNDVVFVWTTDVTSTTSLFLRRIGETEYTEYTGLDGTGHGLLVAGLERNTTYEWYAQSESVCGVEESSIRTVTVENGLVFTQRSYDFLYLERDYDQRVTLQVRNTDDIAHTLMLTLTVPTEDVIVGFVGSGSIDEEITLEPGETKDVTLAIHLQDAVPNETYYLVAHLTADDGTTEPIVDQATVRVRAFVEEVEIQLEQIDHDPETLERTFRVTNSELSNIPLTDLAVTYELLSGQGALLIAPTLNHARLEIGASREFTVIPLLGEGAEGMQVRLTASAAGQEVSTTFHVSCEAGCSVLEGVAENVMMEARSGDWYCTNRPVITTYIDLPGGFRRANVANAELRVTIKSMWHTVQPHDAEFYVNGHKVGGYYNVIPNGVYIFSVDPAHLKETIAGVSRNAVTIRTLHMNGGHYVVSTDIALSICLTEYKEWVCAENQAQADEIVRNREYLIPAADAITTRVLEPADGDAILAGTLVQVSATVTDSLSSGRIYAVVGSADNGNAGLMLYDDGYHGDGLAGDCLYGNTWTPVNPGWTTLTVEAGNCQIVGSDSVTLLVHSAETSVDLSHVVPKDGVAVVESSFSHDPLTTTVGADDIAIEWTYELSSTERTRVTSFDLQLTDMQPGEMRRVASSTVIDYQTVAGPGTITLGPLYAIAAHLVTVDQPVLTTNPGGRVSYEARLFNPGHVADTYTVTLQGLPSGWAADSVVVAIDAGAQKQVSLPLVAPDDALLGPYEFAAMVENSLGGRDSAQLRIELVDLVAISVEPQEQAADGGEMATYAVTVTNLESVERVYDLTIDDGLAGNEVGLPDTLSVAGSSSATATLQVTAHADTGPHRFTVTATSETAGRVAQARAEGVLVIVSDEYGVQVSFEQPAESGARGNPAYYELHVTNMGNVEDSYNLVVSVPPGWSYELRDGTVPVYEITLPPLVRNRASLQLIVTPMSVATPGEYELSVAASSQTATEAQHTARAILEVLAYGVDVELTPESTTMDPFGMQSWDLLVTNTGAELDTFDLVAEGAISSQNGAAFSSSEVTLQAGDSTVVQLIAGPLPSAPPERDTFTVVAQSQSESAVVDHDSAEVIFEGIASADMSLLPESQTVEDALEADFLARVTNSGNADDVYAFDGTSVPELEFEFEPISAYLSPGESAAVALTITAPTEGDYTITVRATSASSGAVYSDTSSLTLVTNRPPEVEAGPDQTVDEGDVVSFIGSFVDPDVGDTHTIEWAFGDGEVASGSLSPTHSYDDDGVYTATLTVVDGEGAAGSDSLLVTVQNVAPVVDAGPDQTAVQGEEVCFHGAFADPGSADTFSIVWRFGDGAVAVGTLTPVHIYAEPGVYTATLSIEDDDGGIGKDTLQVVVRPEIQILDVSHSVIHWWGGHHSPFYFMLQGELELPPGYAPDDLTGDLEIHLTIAGRTVSETISLHRCGKIWHYYGGHCGGQLRNALIVWPCPGWGGSARVLLIGAFYLDGVNYWTRPAEAVIEMRLPLESDPEIGWLSGKVAIEYYAHWCAWWYREHRPVSPCPCQCRWPWCW